VAGWRVYGRHVLPNIASTLIVSKTLAFPEIILLESGLSFLGLGVQPPATSLGSMVGYGREYLTRAPWILLSPAVVIVLTTFSVLGGLAAGQARPDAAVVGWQVASGLGAGRQASRRPPLLPPACCAKVAATEKTRRCVVERHPNNPTGRSKSIRILTESLQFRRPTARDGRLASR
jgi:hypothetical protein